MSLLCETQHALKPLQDLPPSLGKQIYARNLSYFWFAFVFLTTTELYPIKSCKNSKFYLFA